jgi:hypothetical protein
MVMNTTDTFVVAHSLGYMPLLTELGGFAEAPVL